MTFRRELGTIYSLLLSRGCLGGLDNSGPSSPTPSARSARSCLAIRSRARSNASASRVWGWGAGRGPVMGRAPHAGRKRPLDDHGRNYHKKSPLGCPDIQGSLSPPYSGQQREIPDPTAPDRVLPGIRQSLWPLRPDDDWHFLQRCGRSLFRIPGLHCSPCVLEAGPDVLDGLVYLSMTE